MKTDLIFILDKSGSMSGLERDTIGGMNSLLKKNKENKDTLVTTILFDDSVNTLYERVGISEVEQLTENDYLPGGCTALLDAVGITVSRFRNLYKKTNKSEKTLVVITTDGYENSSREYDYKKLKKLIEQTKEEGFEYVFLGANIDAENEASKFGLSSCEAVNYTCDSKGTDLLYKAVSKRVSMCLANCKMDDSWRKEIDKDYKSRKKK